MRDSSEWECDVNRRVKEGLTEKVAFEQICGGGEEGSSVDTGKNVQAGEQLGQRS